MERKQFDQKRFRQLLKKGIGNREQKQFAKQVKIAPETITRMLNDEVISCPRKKTLEMLAENMKNVYLSELLDACGYEVPKIEDVIDNVLSDIDDFFAFAKYNNNGLILFENCTIEQIADRLNIFLKVKSSTTCSMFFPDYLGSSDDVSNADDFARFCIVWEYDFYKCKTDITIPYTATSKGNILVFYNLMDTIKPDDSHGYCKEYNNTVYKEKYPDTKEGRLLAAIFGDDEYNDTENVVTVECGYGFVVDGIPEGFLDFLNEHASTFCNTEENIALYHKAVECRDMEEAAPLFVDEEAGFCTVNYIIAEIMSQETGLDYQYYDNEEVPEDLRTECVVERAKNNHINREDMDERAGYLYQCAKTLKLPTFGAVYYNTILVKNKSLQYNTEEYYTS